MKWFKWYVDTATNPVIRKVARDTKFPVGYIIAIWYALLDAACGAEDEGSLAAFNPEEFDARFELENGTFRKIIEALTECGWIKDNRIADWEEKYKGGED